MPLLLLFTYVFLFIVHVGASVRRRSHVCTCVLLACGSGVSVCSVAVLQECVEQSCVGACRSYFRLSGDAAAAAAAF